MKNKCVWPKKHKIGKNKYLYFSQFRVLTYEGKDQGLNLKVFLVDCYLQDICFSETTALAEN